MPALTETMKTIIANHTIGFYATVNEDGTPSLSPKGTSIVLDDDHIVFGEIRSPGTLRNLRERPAIEVNFLDILARKGVRVRGKAEVIAKGSAAFDEIRPGFDQWGDLARTIGHFVRIRIESAKLITSPAYDIGATEESLRTHWKAYYQAR